MNAPQVQLAVQQGAQSYPYFLHTDSWSALTRWCSDAIAGRELFILSHDALRGLYGDQLDAALTSAGCHAHWHGVPVGECSKSLAVVESIYHALHAQGADRNAVLLSFGGGVIGDLGGYVASTYLRGIPWLNVPTTVLAQVDSCLGGKTGVNAAWGKNVIGSFYAPRAIFANLAVNQTLSVQARNAGLVEAFKAGLLADPALLDHVLSPNAYADVEMIARSAQIKADVVATDPEERGGARRLLNLGHTVAHALEQHTAYAEWSHGAAVGVGLCAAAQLSVRWGYAKPDLAETVRQGVQALQMPTELPKIPSETWQQLLRSDKKRDRDMLHYIALRAPGDPVQHAISVTELAETLCTLSS